MKLIRYAFAAMTLALSLHGHACSISLQDNIQLPLNSADVGNRERLSLTRHYLTAREWTAEGTTADVDVAAFENEQNPRALAALRGANVREFLMQLGLPEDAIYIRERIIKLSAGKIDPDDKWQIGVEFVPKCSSSGCQSLCNTSGLKGVTSYAVTPETPGPAPESYGFTCGDKRDQANDRVVESEIWTEKTENKTLTLNSGDSLGKPGPLPNTCYRVTTSARNYIGMTDDQGRTQSVQLLGPEYTKIEVKVRTDR